MKTIKIIDLINSTFAVKTEDGDLVFNTIIQEFLKSNKVSLNFEGINLMTTAFLNAAIGQLYSDEKTYSSDYLNEFLKLENVPKEDIELFVLVIKRAKEYFKKKDDLNSSINSSFYGM